MKNSDLLYMGLKVPQWKTPLAVSVLIHLLIVLLIFFLAPVAKKATEKPIITRLITPNEWMREFPERSRVPSDALPKQLYGDARGSSAPRSAVPRQVKPRKETQATPAPVQPLARVPERTVAPDTAAKGLADRTPSIPGKSDVGTPRKSDTATNLPRSSGITTPVPSPRPGSRFNPFDPEILGKVVAKNEQKTHDNSITFDAGEFRYEGYMNKLKEKIESIWVYPHDAARRGIQGDLKIRFTIRKNGKLDDVEVIRTSGYRDLDEAAVQALKDGNPFWPLPDDWGKDSLTITGHFIYSLYGTYIR